MKKLFRDDKFIYYIDDDFLKSVDKDSIIVDLNSVKHLDDAKVLYHYIDRDGYMYQVYYEHNGRFITRRSYGYNIFSVPTDQSYKKDYTLVNLNLI